MRLYIEMNYNDAFWMDKDMGRTRLQQLQRPDHWKGRVPIGKHYN